MSLSLTDFKHSAAGQTVRSVLTQPDTIRRMEELSRASEPAVLALDERLAGRVMLDNTQRQHVGRWIKEVLGARGWQVADRKNFGKRKIFSSGSIYARPSPPPSATAPPDAGSAGLAHARELVRQHSTNSYGVDDFIADKRREASRER